MGTDGGYGVEAAAEARVRIGMRDAVQGESLWQDAWRRLKKNKMAMAGLVVTILMSFSAAFAGQISPFNPGLLRQLNYNFSQLITPEYDKSRVRWIIAKRIRSLVHKIDQLFKGKKSCQIVWAIGEIKRLGINIDKSERISVGADRGRFLYKQIIDYSVVVSSILARRGVRLRI